MPAPTDIFEQQKRNQRATFLIMSLFVLFFGFLGYGFDLFFFGNDIFGIVGEPSGSLPIATLIALGIGIVSAFWSMENGAKAVLRSTGAYPINQNNLQHQMLYNVVEEMKIASGLPMPQIYVIPDTDPNAFATGKDPEHSYIAVTEGLLEKLDREELQGVIAHEMSHVKNYDIRLMTVIAALVGAIVLLSDFGRNMMRFGAVGRGMKSRGSSKKNGGPVLIIIFALWLIAVILAPIISQLMAMAVSRKREYLADASGAELTRNPIGLARALEKLDSFADPTTTIKKGSAHLCIVDPLGKTMNLREGGVSELFGTHPPIKNRIELLKAMAYQPHTV